MAIRWSGPGRDVSILYKAVKTVESIGEMGS
jgi:hypothetical protein